MLGDVVFCLVVVALHEGGCAVFGEVEGVEAEEFLDEGDSLAGVLAEHDGVEFFACVATYLQEGADVVVFS